MIIFGKYKFVLDVSGLTSQNGIKNFVARFTFSILFFAFIPLTWTFLALNYHQDIDKSLIAVCTILAQACFIPTYFHLTLNRVKLYSLLDDLQDIVLESV